MPTLKQDTAHHTIRHQEVGSSRPYIVTFSTLWTSASESLGSLGAEIGDAWADEWVVAMDSQVTCVDVLSQGLDTASVLHDAVTPVNRSGTGGGTFLPPQCSLLIRKVSGFGGRPNRGRTYVPKVLAETDVDDIGSITTSALANFQVRASAFLVRLAVRVPASDMILLHADPLPIPVVISQFIVDPRIATQRRRLRK